VACGASACTLAGAAAGHPLGRLEPLEYPSPNSPADSLVTTFNFCTYFGWMPGNGADIPENVVAHR
jgi:hypothetical protein